MVDGDGGSRLSPGENPFTLVDELEEELEKLKEATLRNISLERVRFAEETFEIVVTLPGPREEPLEEAMRGSLASHLAARVNKAVEKAKAEGRRPVGFLDAKIAYSDQADCDEPEGEWVSAFPEGGRCYRIVLTIATPS